MSLFTLLGVFKKIDLSLSDHASTYFEKRVDADDVIIVAIDTLSFQEASMSWPWPRSQYAELLAQAKSAGARAVVFDIVFDQQTKEDAEFAKSIASFGTVILASEHSVVQTPQGLIETLVLPTSELSNSAAAIGTARLPVDEDSRLRRMPDYAVQGQHSLVEVAAMVMGKKPRESNEQSYIRFAKADHPIPAVSFYQALDPSTFLPEDIFKDKVLIVGLSMAANPAALSFVGDEVLIPDYAAKGQGFQTGRVPGLVAQASALQTALAESALKRVPYWVELSIGLLAFALSLMSAHLAKTDLRRAMICIGITLALLLMSLYFARSMGSVLMIAPALIGSLTAGLFQAIYAGLKSFLERRKLVTNFGKYVAPEILKTILESSTPPSLGGELRTVSIIVTDLEGYTALMDALSPEEGAQILRAYLDVLGQVVLEHGGMIDQFIGDSIVAIFNAPLDQPDHASRAIECVFALQAASLAYQKECIDAGIPLGITRIGAHYGQAVVGNFGSKDRFHYTAMGDVVNVASRLEAANKTVNSQILISQDLYEASGASTSFLPLGEMGLYGKSHLISIYTSKGDLTSEDIKAYHIAYELVCEGHKIAQEKFEGLRQAHRDNCALNYMCAALQDGLIQKPKMIIGK